MGNRLTQVLIEKEEQVLKTSEVICDKQAPDLSEDVRHSRAPTQPDCRWLERHRYAFCTWDLDLYWVCGDRHGKSVPLPAIPGSLSRVVP